MIANRYSNYRQKIATKNYFLENIITAIEVSIKHVFCKLKKGNEKLSHFEGEENTWKVIDRCF